MTQEHIELRVKGMTCANCALSIENYLKREGLEDISVNFSMDEVSFDQPSDKSLPKIVRGIEKLGFQVLKESESQQEEMDRSKRLILWVCVAFTIPLLLHMLVNIHWLHHPYVQLALATPVYLLGMWHFGRSALKSLNGGVPNMDVLISIGATAAFFYSLYGTLTEKGPDFLFYETAASIITIVMIGNYFEHRAVKRTTSAVKALTRLQQQKATKVIVKDGEEQFQQINAQHIQRGDTLFIPQGEKIPADGTILAGEGEVDESMITGESQTVYKQIGHKVVGGTSLIDGSLRMKVHQTGKEAVLGKIIEMVKKAQADKPSIQLLADKISAIFVPVVVSIAALTFILSYAVFGLSMQAAIIHSVAVLVISCPCAMGLATPTAVVVGLGRASRKGILIKGGRTLESFSDIQRVVFDKTGTLTTGQFTISAIHTSAEKEKRVKSLMLSLEQHSAHPIAQSIVKALSAYPTTPLDQVREIKGMGIEARDSVANTHIQLGSYRLASHLTRDDTHHLYLIEQGQLIATIDLQDEVKAEAPALVQFLHSQNIQTVLLSGDRKAATEKVGNQLGIQQIYAEQLPEEKLALIEQLTAEAPTAMVGDGINDAPALTRATVGISLGNATQIAIDSAQIVLLRDDLRLVKEVFLLGKMTVKTIRQNLFWAFFYNVLAIPLAALGFLSPIIGALAMGLSDIMVVGNSLLLRTKSLTYK